MYLVDTSVLVNYLKGSNTKGTRFFEKLTEQDFCITGVIYQEVLQGARDLKEFNALKEYLSTQIFCHPRDPIATYEQAASLYFECRRQGFTVRSTTDCLIAQLAFENELILLHEDRDFDALMKVRRVPSAL